MTIRFHLDECVRSAVAVALRHHEINVTTAHETGLVLTRIVDPRVVTGGPLFVARSPGPGGTMGMRFIHFPDQTGGR